MAIENASNISETKVAALVSAWFKNRAKPAIEGFKGYFAAALELNVSESEANVARRVIEARYNGK